MFKINPNPTFTAEANIAVPGQPAEKLKLVFRHKTRAEVKTFCDRVAEAAKAAADEHTAGARDAALRRRSSQDGRMSISLSPRKTSRWCWRTITQPARRFLTPTHRKSRRRAGETDRGGPPDVLAGAAG
jgi:hypothetical protein